MIHPDITPTMRTIMAKDRARVHPTQATAELIRKGQTELTTEKAETERSLQRVRIESRMRSPRKRGATSLTRATAGLIRRGTAGTAEEDT